MHVDDLRTNSAHWSIGELCQSRRAQGGESRLSKGIRNASAVPASAIMNTTAMPMRTSSAAPRKTVSQATKEANASWKLPDESGGKSRDRPMGGVNRTHG